jgi:excisionase family DNA binding protein
MIQSQKSLVRRVDDCYRQVVSYKSRRRQEESRLDTTIETEVLFVSVEEAARRLGGISTRTVWRLAAEDGLPVVHLRGRVLFPVAELRAWATAQSARVTP